MKLNKTGSPLTRQERNELNKNWEKIEKNFNNVVEKVAEEAFDKVIDGSKIDWSQMVETPEDLPADAEEGSTRGVVSDNRIYRFDGTEWVPIAEINLNPISEVEGRLNDKIDDTKQEIEQQYREDINVVDEQLTSHVDEKEIHRSIYYDDDPEPTEYEEGNIILTPRPLQSGMVLLDEAHLPEGTIGEGTDLFIPYEYHGKIKTFILEINGGMRYAEPNGPEDVLPVIVRVNGDTNENHRHAAIARNAVTGEVEITHDSAGSDHPRTGYLGYYNGSVMRATFVSPVRGETNALSWYSEGWTNGGSNLGNSVIWSSGGRYDASEIITHFQVRGSGTSHEWVSNTSATLWGVL